MKTLTRIGAGLSFTFLLLSGLILLANSGLQMSGVNLLGTVLGLFLVGTACFAGTLLWLTAERGTAASPSCAPVAFERVWPWKATLALCGVIIAVIAVLHFLRMTIPVVVPQTAIAP